MRIFVVIAQNELKLADIEAAIVSNFAQDNNRLRKGVWLVGGNGTAKDVSDKLGITPDGINGTAVVFPIETYYGRWDPSLWDWLRIKLDQKDV